MSGPVIEFPTEEEGKALLAKALKEQAAMRSERREAAALALPALERLVAVMLHRTGQGHTLRKLLYSLWNGQATSLLDVVELDWALRKDFCAVVMGFGFNGVAGTPDFFYDQVKAEIEKAGLWQWFLKAGKEGGAS